MLLLEPGFVEQQADVLVAQVAAAVLVPDVVPARRTRLELLLAERARVVCAPAARGEKEGKQLVMILYNQSVSLPLQFQFPS